MSDETVTTNIVLMPPAERALIVLNSTKTEADLKAMVEEAAALTEVKDAAGRDQAHGVGMRLKRARTTIEKVGKAARDDANAFAKAVIDEQKRLIAITEAEEKRVIGLRDAFDERMEAEKRAIEAKRAEVKGKIDGIRALPLALAGASSDEIAAEKDALQAFTPTHEVFGDQTDDCVLAIGEAVRALGDLHARVLAQETAAAALEAERRRAEEALAAERARIEEERAALEAMRATLARERAELEAQRAAAEAAAAAAQAEVAVQSGAETEPTDAVAEPTFEEMTAAIVEAQAEAVAEAHIDALVSGMGIIQGGQRIDPATVYADQPQAAPLGDEFVDAATPTDWGIRGVALATCRQFEALATKVDLCGFHDFAAELRGAAQALSDGAFDHELSGADPVAMSEADRLLLDATVECIEALESGEKEAA